MRLIDPESAAGIIKGLVPDWAWLLGQIESADGYVRFPPQFSRAIVNLNLENYPLLYEKETSLGAMLLLAFMAPDEIQELDRQLNIATEQERGQALAEVMEDLSTAFDSFQLPKTPTDERKAREAFDALPEEERTKVIASTQRFWMATIPSFYQSLSVMVHGQKLTSLVAQAKAGDDKAFVKAIQIDKRILSGIPYFKQRFDTAGMEGDSKLTEEIGENFRRPPYIGRIRHKSLYLAFSLLEIVGLLDMPRKELLDLLDEAGVGGYKNRIEDEKNLSKRLADYRRFQQIGMDLSTP